VLHAARKLSCIKNWTETTKHVQMLPHVQVVLGGGLAMLDAKHLPLMLLLALAWTGQESKGQD